MQLFLSYIGTPDSLMNVSVTTVNITNVFISWAEPVSSGHYTYHIYDTINQRETIVTSMTNTTYTVHSNITYYSLLLYYTNENSTLLPSEGCSLYFQTTSK